jgi:DNA topoisomerase IA
MLASSRFLIGNWFGMNVAWLHTVKHGGYKVFYLLKRKTLTLAMVVDRFKEIEKFQATTLLTANFA